MSQIAADLSLCIVNSVLYRYHLFQRMQLLRFCLELQDDLGGGELARQISWISQSAFMKFSPIRDLNVIDTYQMRPSNFPLAEVAG